MSKLLFLILISTICFGQVLEVNKVGTTTNIYGTVNLVGEFTYAVPHGIYSFSGNTTIAVSQNVYSKLVLNYSIIDTLGGFVLTGDTFKLKTVGHYTVGVYYTQASLVSTDDFRYQCRLSGVPLASTNRLSSMGNNNFNIFPYEWYIHVSNANSYISFFVTNTAGNNDPSYSDAKILIFKIPEKIQ